MTIPKSFDDVVSRVDIAFVVESSEVKITFPNTFKTRELLHLTAGRKQSKQNVISVTKSDGEEMVLRFKARHVVKQLTHVEDIYFQNVCAPVARYISIPVAFLVFLRMKLVRIVLDTKDAFLSTPLKATIYLKEPDGFVILGKKDWVSILRRSLYSLH